MIKNQIDKLQEKKNQQKKLTYPNFKINNIKENYKKKTNKE